MREFQQRWEELQKALNHSAAIARVTPPSMPAEPEPTPHPDHMPKVKYGMQNMPGMAGAYGEKGDAEDKIGTITANGKTHVVRHGQAAHRTDVEHQMSKLLGADHMLPNQTYDHGINHHNHHGKETFDPHKHAGTSFQEHDPGESIFDTKHIDKLRDQWKSGDLHKLWALHYISNNGDMHGGNFNIGKDGVKAFDSDHAFYELPQAHIIQHRGNNKHELEYMPYAFNQLPSYIAPFVEHEHENDEGIDPDFKGDQVHVNALNEHGKNINPDLFEEFGPHAADRARKAKRALMSADPTGEMKKLWSDHSDKTGDLLFDHQEKKAS